MVGKPFIYTNLKDGVVISSISILLIASLSKSNLYMGTNANPLVSKTTNFPRLLQINQ